MYELNSKRARLLIDEKMGGRAVSWQIADLQVLKPMTDKAVIGGWYAMAPWAGRISNNQIKFKHSTKISTTTDIIKGLGPLGGILTAMKWIKNNKKDYKWISTFPSDTPFFTKNELKIFYEKIDIKKNKLFFIKNKNTRHNIFGLWSMDLLGKLESDIQKGERKVELWADSVDVKIINVDYKEKDPFFNINTKEDLEKAYKMMEND